MPERAVYQRVAPIGDTDPQNLPVRDLESAVPFYETKMGFVVKSRSDSPCKSALLARDAIEIRLAENGGEPEQASCYMAVSDVDAAFQELSGRELDISPDIRTDEYGGKKYRVFFVRAPDGLCYCLGQQA